MTKKTWADVRKLDVVRLGGREWTVAKIKAKGKKATVTVELGRRSASSVVKLSDVVKVTGRAKVAPSGVADAGATQQRWAKKSELAAVMDSPKGLPAGDSAATKPPEKATGGVWDRPSDRVEKMLEKMLGATLVGEAKDEAQGYYVPPVDVSTVAAHLALFHGGIPERAEDEAAMLAVHTAQHAAAAKGEGVLAVNHWHTAKRP